MNKTVFIDIETTGFSRQWDSIIELAAVLVDQDTQIELDTFHMYAKPKRPIPAKITELTGITNAQVSNCPNEERMLMEFTEWLINNQVQTIVGHNCKSFDLNFITNKCEFYHMPIDFSTYNIIDTLVVARQLKKEGLITVENCQQPTIAKFFDINYDAHSALEDVRALIKIYNKMINLQQDDVGF